MESNINGQNQGINQGDNIAGYVVGRIAEMEVNNSIYYELEHEATGARHIHISSNDTENTFCVLFKTLPEDSTGAAHILEHTVLCGSKKFPVRDPFFSMLKKSLSTYMNASTSSSWTMFPFCTQNRQDYYNLMDVYLDAAFFPNLDELNFRQEGHRLDVEGDVKEDGSFRLVYKGIVYNEMKGAMSSAAQVMVRSLQKVMYPSTPYRYNSGGEPADIPSLTYQKLKEFHEKYYHPSNSYFYTYGDLPLKEHLQFIQDRVLKKYKRVKPVMTALSQPRWSESRETTCYYPIAKNEDRQKKCQVCVAWLTVDINDSFEVLAMALLEHILLGNSASPLRRELIECGLGTALCDASGYISSYRDTMFACGLKDVEETSAERIQEVIFDVLNNLVESGVNRDLVESAIHQIEFYRKEITNTPYPYGLKQFVLISSPWIHGVDPLKIIQLDEDLKKIKVLSENGDFFEGLIKKYLIENPHRMLFTLAPDQTMAEKESERVRAELGNIKNTLSVDDVQKILKQGELLKELQETDNDVSSLPTLERKDIPAEINRIEESNLLDASDAACYHQPTSGISYFALAADATEIEPELIPYVSFFCNVFTRIGTAVHSYSEMAQKVDRYTGGIGMGSHSRTGFKTGYCVPFISFNGKCLARNQGQMFEIIEEFLFQPDFSDLLRLKNILLEHKAGLDSMIVSSGHRIAMSLAARNFSRARRLNEIWNGVFHLKTIKEMSANTTDDNLQNIVDNLTRVGKILLNPNHCCVALIGEEKDIADSLKTVTQNTNLSSLLKRSVGNDFGPPKIETSREMVHEGWSTSSSVSFVARVFETARMEHEDAPTLAVISRIIRSLYLHREIREKGGAYGAFALYNPEDGIFCYVTYRDPHIYSTLKVFDNTADFIRSGNYNDEDIDEAILQVCSDMYKPDSPGPAARKAFFRKVISLSDDIRQQFKKRVLSVTRDQVVEVAEKYFIPDTMNHSTVVVSGEVQLEEANKKLDVPLEIHQIR